MGIISTTLIKRTGQKLFKAYPEKFGKEFDNNKKAVMEVAEVHSKKLRNVIAGYITKLVKNSQE